jgi:lipoate-protein ligase B
VSCGLKDYSMTSLSNLLEHPPTLAQVMDTFVVSFGEIFNFSMVEEGWDDG